MQLLTYHPFGYNAILLPEMNSLRESQTIARKFWVEAWIEHAGVESEFATRQNRDDLCCARRDSKENWSWCHSFYMIGLVVVPNLTVLIVWRRDQTERAKQSLFQSELPLM